MHWLLLVANTVAGEPVTISAHRTEASCKAAQVELARQIAEQQNQAQDLNKGNGPWIKCKAADAEELSLPNRMSR